MSRNSGSLRIEAVSENGCLTFSYVKIRSAEVRALIHRRRRVDEKQDDSHRDSSGLLISSEI